MLLWLGTFLVLGVAIAVGAVFGDLVRAFTAACGVIAVGVAVWRTRLVVQVDSEGVRVAPAHIAWPYVDAVSVLEGAAMRSAITTEAHPNDYLRIRGTDGGLRLALDDPTDPHRCWVVSIRDVASLRGVIAALESEGIIRAG